MISSLPLVSVIVATRNEESVLAGLLESIAGQGYPNIEIIVVDNGSDDRTKEIGRHFTADVYDHGSERCEQRNYGVTRSSGTYLLFADADMELTSKVVSECVALALSDTGIKGIIIPEESFGAGFWSNCKALERSCYVGDSTIEAARFVERQAFLDIGGYDDALIGGEDWDLSCRLESRYRIGRISALILHNERSLSLHRSVRKKYYYATTFRAYAIRHRRDAFRHANLLLRPAFFRSWSHLIRHPFLLCGMLFMKSCEMTAGGLGFLVSLWLRP